MKKTLVLAIPFMFMISCSCNHTEKTDTSLIETPESEVFKRKEIPETDFNFVDSVRTVVAYANYKDYRKETIDLNESSQGGNITYIFTKRSVHKIEAQRFGDMGKYFTTIYLRNGSPFYVIETTHTYNAPISLTREMADSLGVDELMDESKSDVYTTEFFWVDGYEARIVSKECGTSINLNTFYREFHRIDGEIEGYMNLYLDSISANNFK